MKQFKTDIEFNEEKFMKSLYFYPNNIEPFPIQRINWLYKLIVCTKSVFSKLKTKCVGDGYLDKLTSLELTDSLIYDAMKDELNSYIYNDSMSFEAKDLNDFYKSAAYNTTLMYNWNVYKQIYRFDKDTFNLLMNVDIDKIPFDIIKNNLPYPAFFIDNTFKSTISGIVFRGCFVSLINMFNGLELCLFFITDTPESDYQYAFVPLYFKEDNLTIEEALIKRNEVYEVDCSESILKDAEGLVSQALKAIIYICSANREIETIKVTVNDNCTKKNKKNKNKKPKTITQNNVGYKMGAAIRLNKKNYVYVDEEGNRIDKRNKGNHKKKSPHLRMGHYHHYWIGSKDKPEERKLILKYVAPLYINSTEAEKATLHNVK